MNVQATDLKSALKKLASAKTDFYTIGPDGIHAHAAEIWIQTESPLSGLGDSFSVHGKKFSQVVNRMSGSIDVSREDRKLTLKSARAKVELEIQPVKPPVFPKIPENLVRLNLAEFKHALQVASASAGTEKSTAYGSVVHVSTLPLGIEEEAPKGYRVAGMDGQVLSVVRVDAPQPRQFTWIINLDAVAAVQIMDGESVEIGEAIDEKFGLYIRSGNSHVFVSKANKAFMEYDKFFPAKFPVRYQFKPEEFASALRTVEPLMDSALDQGAVHLKFDTIYGNIKTINQGSTAEDGLGVEQLDPDPVFEPTTTELKLSAKHLQNFLAKAGPEAVIAIDKPDRPVKLESGNLISLTMPVLPRKK